MKSGVARWLMVAVALLVMPAMAMAQEATLTGTVTDATGGVLPGVTVTAVHEATGNTFVGVTDERGIFRIPARVGGYRLTAELSGFTTVTRSGVNLLIGQTANLSVQMTVTGVAETVTVTGEAPLLNTTQSTLAGNIDPRQMRDLPSHGNEWMTLALLAPGNRTNAAGATPIQDRGDVREFQLNMDGQQVTNNIGPGAQPKFSRASVGEFQFISNRFDATQGRSLGVQVNAITRSGTNSYLGSLGGYFQDSDWNAEDHVLNRKVPSSAQSYDWTAGGPILRDRLHFFFNYEYRRSPRSTIANTAFPAFNITLTGKDSTKLAVLRLDYQLSSQNRVMLKGNHARQVNPFSDLGSNHPAGSGDINETTNNFLAQFTSVFGTSAVNEVKFGPSSFKFKEANLTTWSNHWRASEGITNGHPRITFTGFSIAGNNNWPRYQLQDIWTLRDDFTLSVNARGRHDLKMGGEVLYAGMTSNNCARCMGNIDARAGALPSVANMQAWFPVWNNADTWNLNAISPLVINYRVGIAKQWPVRHSHPKWGAWLQDDWAVSDRLTLNLGLRYDLIWNANNQARSLEPWMAADRPQDADNVQPRLGFAYRLNDLTVLRGGGGLYYPDVIGSQFSHSTRVTQLVYVTLQNDGRPDFASNPFNGPTPTYDQVLAQACDQLNRTTNCYFRGSEELAPPTEFNELTDTWQMSFGVQRQLRSDMAVEVDYVRNRGRGEKVLHNNVNLRYDPNTGANLPFATPANRLMPTWDYIGYYAYTGRSDYHGLQTSFTKRLSNRWQFSANYTLSQIKNDEPSQPISGQTLVPFTVQPDMGGEYGLAVTDQRHRAVFNGILEVGGGFQVSGLYFFGSGQRQESSCGGERRGQQGASPPARLCAPTINPALVPGGIVTPAGIIVPRNDFVQDQIHRVDMRLQQRIPLGRVSVDGMLEFFNLFDRANYASYTLDRSSPVYGDPVFSSNICVRAANGGVGLPGAVLVDRDRGIGDRDPGSDIRTRAGWATARPSFLVPHFDKNTLFGILADTSCARSTASATWKSTARLASENAFAGVRPFSSTRNLTVSVTDLRIARSRSRSMPIRM